MTYQAKVIAGGKIVIPAELRREIGIEEGDSLVIERNPGGGLVIKTYLQVVRETQSRFRALLKPDVGDLVDSLIADRRAEIARETAQAASASAQP